MVGKIAMVVGIRYVAGIWILGWTYVVGTHGTSVLVFLYLFSRRTDAGHLPSTMLLTAGRRLCRALLMVRLLFRMLVFLYSLPRRTDPGHLPSYGIAYR